MRAAYPHTDGYAVNSKDGVRVFYEVFGPADAERTIVFLPTWTLVTSQIWKGQVPYFSRSGFRVVTFDNRGNGKSDRPATGYSVPTIADDALAVLEATGVERAALVGFSGGGKWAVRLAANHPDLVTHLVLIATGMGGGMGVRPSFHAPYDGSNKVNAEYWRQDFRGFLEYWGEHTTPEPHSTKQHEDLVEWGLGTTPEILYQTATDRDFHSDDYLGRITCPTLIIHGSLDRGFPPEAGENLQKAIPGAQRYFFEGAGHALAGRDPVRADLVIHEFVGSARQRPAVSPRTWRRAMTRGKKRALFVSSPIGLGHVQRDLAIADALRQIEPNVEIDWLAQDPVTQVLTRRGERLHPISQHLAGESADCVDHELPIFKAWRRMDEILLANFMVFHDAVKDDAYDLWVADEGWDVDYYLHENPELKTAPVAWLTDFVGWLPTDGQESWLTTDYNAEMIEQVERFPRVRDRSIFVGNPDDIVPGEFGPGLPSIRQWTESQFCFPGYVQYFDPQKYADRDRIREELGCHPDERVVFAAVGGTSVGRGLLERIITSYHELRRRVPALRLVVVAGPRIDPASLPQVPGIDYRGYVHNLHEQLAACDLALVQGGLSTTMELVATQRPFLYFPLRSHFEQMYLVPHRLANYGVPADARVDYRDADPDHLAELIERSLRTPPAYRPIETGGAERAARTIAELI